MSTKLEKHRIVRSRRPLVIARAAIDEVCKEQRGVVEQQLQEGADLSRLIEEPVEHPLLKSAGVLLQGARQDKDLRWTEWLQLKIGMATFRQRVFFPYLFSDKQQYVAQRRALQMEAYAAHAALTTEALGIYGKTRGAAHEHMLGALGELVTLALLNRNRPAWAAAFISSAAADTCRKIDAVYTSYDVAKGTPDWINLQIKASGSTLLNGDVVQIGVFETLGDDRNRLQTAQLIAKDAKGTLAIGGQQELVRRGALLQSTILNAVAMQDSCSAVEA